MGTKAWLLIDVGTIVPLDDAFTKVIDSIVLIEISFGIWMKVKRHPSLTTPSLSTFTILPSIFTFHAEAQMIAICDTFKPTVGMGIV